MRAIAIALALAGGCNDNSNVQRRPIGVACATSGQCGTGRFFCAGGQPSGYCSADCRGDGDCPAGSVCAGGPVGDCRRSCETTSDCRSGEGYSCVLGGASHAYCDVPAPQPDGGG
jgi:hypothetical protein